MRKISRADHGLHPRRSRQAEILDKIEIWHRGQGYDTGESPNISLSESYQPSSSGYPESSHNQPYDPSEDRIHAQKYASEWQDLKFYQIFRYANWFDWILMTIGVFLAIAGSMATPWLYYWSSLTLHDVLIFQFCKPTTSVVNGITVCDIKNFCDTTLSTVGYHCFLKILFGWLAYNFFQLCYTICFTIAADRQTKAMRAAYFESLVHKDMAWFDMYADKNFAKEITEQISVVRLGIGDTIPSFINMVCVLVAMIVIVLYLNYKAALCFICFIPVSEICVYTGNWAERKRGLVTDKLYEKANSVAKESLVNIKVIKMYEAEKKQAMKFREMLENKTKEDKLNSRKELMWMAMAAISSGFIWFLLNIATALTFWYGVNDHKEDANAFCEDHKEWGLTSLKSSIHVLKTLDFHLRDGPGQLLFVYLTLMFIALHAVEFPKLLQMMHDAKISASGVFFIINWKSRIDNLCNEGKTPKRNAVGRLDFSDVTFRYPRRPDLTVLKIRQLTIFDGQFIAFFGPQNSGKNTILKLIPRLYDCCSGFITLDAVNVQNYNLQWLRRQVCIVSEAPVIFSGTIAENILFGKLDANEGDVHKACQFVGVHQKIETLPNGYNTKISSKEFGDCLTRNEKRKVCLARAYLHRSRLILLDNPMQPENDELEELLLGFVRHFRSTSTVILTSSQVTALSKRADCIYYMEKGEILESGNHMQLIQSRGKYYSQLEGTVNCSTESRNEFESQLKAYKYSQLLQQKRKSSSVGVGHGEYIWEDIGTGSVGGVPRRHLWNSFVKTLLGYSLKGTETSTGDLNVADAHGDVEEGKSENRMSGTQLKKSSILKLGKSKQSEASPVEISNLEATYETYNPDFEKNKKSAQDNRNSYMHKGFGMMGVQRLIFARPMTNYATQIQKQRKGFSSTNKGNYHLNVLRAQKVSSPELGTEEVAEVDESSDERLGSRVQFSLHDSSRNIHDHSKAPPPPNPPNQSQEMGEHPNGALKQSNLKKTIKRNSKSRPGTLNKPKPRGSVINQNLNRSKSRSSAGKNKVKKSLTKLASKRSLVKNKLSVRQMVDERKSVQDALNRMTPSAPFHLNERIEIDNVSIETQDLDAFLAEYDEGVYSTLSSEVKGFWRDIFYVVSHHWRFIIPAIIASVVLGVSIPCQIWTIGMLLQAFGCYDYNENDREIIINRLIVYIIVIGAVTAVAAFIQEFSFGLAGKKMARGLREKLFAHILIQDLVWFEEKAHDIGILTFQLDADAMVVQHVLLTTYGIAMQVIFNLATSMVLVGLGTLNDCYILPLCFALLMPFQIALVYLSSKGDLIQASQLERRFKGLFVQEFLGNLQTWFSLGAETFFISQHKKLLDNEYRFIQTYSSCVIFFHSVVQTASWLLYGIFIYFALKKEHVNTIMPATNSAKDSLVPFIAPTLVGFIMIHTELLIFAAYRVGDQLAGLTDVELGKSAAHKIMRILVNQPDTDNSSKMNVDLTDELLEEDFNQPPPEIGLTNITYYYPGTDQSSRVGHLHEVSMTIPSGSYAAIVGPPGSGKTTLCNIMLRMYNPTAGILDFNGDDSFDLSPKFTRRHMSHVEFDPCMFDCSIFENILYGKKILQDDQRIDVEEAAKLSNCHFDILDLPQDYQTLVQSLEKTEDNFTLKQRISYARALLKKPKILLVDDAATSVNVEADHKLLQVLANVKEHRTLIVFSHKIEPIRDANVIFVLWEGEIVESGTDSFLLTKKGYYYEMFMTQKVLAESMRSSPQQLSTIRYNIKKLARPKVSLTDSKMLLKELALSQKKNTKSPSSVAFVKFLNEKVSKLKQEKQQWRTELEKELPALEMEKKQRDSEKKNEM